MTNLQNIFQLSLVDDFKQLLPQCQGACALPQQTEGMGSQSTGTSGRGGVSATLVSGQEVSPKLLGVPVHPFTCLRSCSFLWPDLKQVGLWFFFFFKAKVTHLK